MRLILLFGIALCACLVAAPAAGQWSEYAYRVVRVDWPDVLYVRAAPSPNAVVVDSLHSEEDDLVLRRCEVLPGYEHLRRRFYEERDREAWVPFDTSRVDRERDRINAYDWPRAASWLHLEGSDISQDEYFELKRRRWCLVEQLDYTDAGFRPLGWVSDYYLARYALLKWTTHMAFDGYPDELRTSRHRYEEPYPTAARILGFRVEPELVPARGTAALTVITADSTEQGLRYFWNLPGAFTETEGPLYLWEAPAEPGEYRLSVGIGRKGAQTVGATRYVTVVEVP